MLQSPLKNTPKQHPPLSIILLHVYTNKPSLIRINTRLRAYLSRFSFSIQSFFQQPKFNVDEYAAQMCNRIEIRIIYTFVQTITYAINYFCRTDLRMVINFAKSDWNKCEKIQDFSTLRDKLYRSCPFYLSSPIVYLHGINFAKTKFKKPNQLTYS